MHHGQEHPIGVASMCCHGHQGRMFLTKEEKIKKLTEYKNLLDNESKGVEETISKLKES